MSLGWPLGMAGEEEADAILGPTEEREADFLASAGGCWSTG
jgi:hypothetical protein